MERYRRGHNENDSKSCGLFLCRTPEIPVALGKFAFPLFPMLDDFNTFSTLCSRLVFRSFAPPNFIRSGIEEVITRTTRNRLTGETVRGFESHPLRQFKSRCKFAYDGIFPRFPVFSSNKLNWIFRKFLLYWQVFVCFSTLRAASSIFRF